VVQLSKGGAAFRGSLLSSATGTLSMLDDGSIIKIYLRCVLEKRKLDWEINESQLVY
jgi:hypothetical protein